MGSIAPETKRYAVIRFLELPKPGIANYQCLPEAWIKCVVDEQHVRVLYPLKVTKEQMESWKQTGLEPGQWRDFSAEFVLYSDFYLQLGGLNYKKEPENTDKKKVNDAKSSPSVTNKMKKMSIDSPSESPNAEASTAPVKKIAQRRESKGLGVKIENGTKPESPNAVTKPTSAKKKDKSSDKNNKVIINNININMPN